MDIVLDSLGLLIYFALVFLVVELWLKKRWLKTPKLEVFGSCPKCNGPLTKETMTQGDSCHDGFLYCDDCKKLGRCGCSRQRP